MSTVKKCDVCEKVFDYGFSVNVNLQGGMSFTNVSKDQFEIGKKDICRECYYKIKKMLTCCCIPK